jgi:hypothetical protein
MSSAHLSQDLIDVFQMTGLLRRTFYQNEKETKYVSIYLDTDNLKPYVKIRIPSGHAVLNEIQWFILVTFKGDIPKNKEHELGDSRHTLSVYCGRYIRIKSENTQVYLCKKNWSLLMDLASGCIDREVIKYGRLQDELLGWRNKCFESKSCCSPPDTNAVEFSTLWDELKFTNTSISDGK